MTPHRGARGDRIKLLASPNGISISRKLGIRRRLPVPYQAACGISVSDRGVRNWYSIIMVAAAIRRVRRIIYLYIFRGAKRRSRQAQARRALAWRRIYMSSRDAQAFLRRARSVAAACAFAAVWRASYMAAHPYRQQAAGGSIAPLSYIGGGARPVAARQRLRNGGSARRASSISWRVPAHMAWRRASPAAWLAWHRLCAYNIMALAFLYICIYRSNSIWLLQLSYVYIGALVTLPPSRYQKPLREGGRR